MFTPNEQSILALGDQYKEIINMGFASKIFLVGPTSLYFTLKTVEHHWKVENQDKNSYVIDVTSLYKNDVKSFGYPQSSRKRNNITSLDTKLSFIESITSFPTRR